MEKSYFSSPVLEPAAIERELLLGAEQGGTARLPDVSVHRLFVPIVEALEGRSRAESPGRSRLVAHRGGQPIETTGRAGAEVLLALGPEGGWIEEELGSFDRAGFEKVSLGPWILPTETAVAAALAQIHLLAE